MNRDEFLTRIHRAAESGNVYRPRVAERTTERVGYIGAGADLLAHMAREVDAVGGRAHIATDRAEAGAIIRRLLDEIRPAAAIRWEHPVLDRVGLAEILAEKGIASSSHTELAKLDAAAQRAQILAADVGISSVECAIAETGTLVVASRPGRERTISLVAPVHIAVVAESQILPDLFDFFDGLERAGLANLASNFAFITGPSKTGDIELTLTTGVHGPGVCHVVLVRGE